MINDNTNYEIIIKMTYDSPCITHLFANTQKYDQRFSQLISTEVEVVEEERKPFTHYIFPQMIQM